MKTPDNQPTSLTANDLEGQTAANTNKTRIIRTWSEFRRAIAESLEKPSADTARWSRCSKPPVCAYSRKRALADGLEVEVRPDFMERMNKEWDFIFESPFFLTKKAVEVCEIASGLSLYANLGPLWHILCVFDNALNCPLLGWGSPIVSRIPLEVSFGTTSMAPRLCLNVAWSTVDNDDPRPSFTVMLPEED